MIVTVVDYFNSESCGRAWCEEQSGANNRLDCCGFVRKVRKKNYEEKKCRVRQASKALETQQTHRGNIWKVGVFFFGHLLLYLPFLLMFVSITLQYITLFEISSPMGHGHIR